MSSYQSNQIKLINTSLIDPHPDNPRKNIGDVNDLRRSLDMDDGDVEATVDPDTGEID